jgi:WD40 repeat protein
LDFDKLGEKIISVSGDQTVRVWNFQKFRETQFLEGHPEQVWSVGASRFNDFFVSGSADNTVKLWDSKTGDELRTFEGHTGEVFSVAFSPLGKKAASGGEDKKVIMWDIMTGEKLHVSNYHSDWVHCVLFSNDGYMLASSDASGLLVIWDVYVDKVKLKVDAHDGQLFSLCFNSTNDHIATSGADSKIKIFEISTGKELHTFEGHEGNVWNVKYLTDDRLVSGAKDGVVIVWNIQTGQIINKLKNESSVQCIAIISSDRVAFSLENGTIRVVDITSSREIKSFHNAEPIWSIDIGKDRNRLISAGGDNTVRIWSLSETKEKFTLKFGTLVFNRNASISANLVNHKQITITDLVEHRETQHHLPDDLVQVVSFTANDNLILLKDDNTYSEYDLRRREQQLVSNINQYNISSADLLLCKGKFARTFDKCSFKKMRGANEEFLQLFQDS